MVVPCLWQLAANGDTHFSSYHRHIQCQTLIMPCMFLKTKKRDEWPNVSKCVLVPVSKWGVAYPMSTSNSGPGECPTIELDSDTIYLVIASDPTGYWLSSTRLTPSSPPCSLAPEVRLPPVLQTELELSTTPTLGFN